MISLEQVRQLDIRVKKAVTAVKNLSAENSALKSEIEELKSKLEELSSEAAGRLAEEQKLEVSLQGVLDALDEVDGETLDVEPEPPADNYVIETVSLDDDSGEIEESIEDDLTEDLFASDADAEDSEGDSVGAAGAGEPLDVPAAETPEEAGEDEEVEESTAGEDLFAAADMAEEETPPVRSEMPADASEAREAERSPSPAESVAEEVPGVGQVVEFTSPAMKTAAAEAPADEVEETGPEDEAEAAEADLLPPEDVNLDEDTGEDELSSEFDIF